jgi:hypothetical protein
MRESFSIEKLSTYIANFVDISLARRCSKCGPTESDEPRQQSKRTMTVTVMMMAMTAK